MKKITATVPKRLHGMRILDFLKSEMHLSVTLIKKAKYGGVFVNGINVHMRHILSEGDSVDVILPTGQSDIKPLPMPLDIVYEDEYMLAVSKPTNMPTHPSRGNHLPTLAEGITAYLNDESFVFRAVNRLDRGTGGIVLIAKDAVTAARLSQIMKSGGFVKRYIALVSGIITPPTGIIDAPIEREHPDTIKRIVRPDGKRAVTEYKTLRTTDDGNSICEITLHTGRTHQIRVHTSYIGHPLVNDNIYGEGNGDFKLHAYYLSFRHPYTNEMIELKSDYNI